MKVAVTGCSGFIGGQILIDLYDAGVNTLGIDWTDLPKHLVSSCRSFVLSNYSSNEGLMALRVFKPDAIIHCAGTSLVGPSMSDPRSYYNNNVAGTLKLLNMVISALPDTHILFSSSAAVYGEPVMVPCMETDPCLPLSPYGESKQMIEQMLTSYSRAYNLKYTAFRYFNACGADSKNRHGQLPGASHIIAQVLAAIKKKKPFTINGNDYDTPDGTCIRDYVHVEDISRAHTLAIHKKLYGIYNLGTRVETSNLDIFNTAIDLTKSDIALKYGPKRSGDPAKLTADANLFGQDARWIPEYTVRDMIRHAWEWQKK